MRSEGTSHHPLATPTLAVISFLVALAGAELGLRLANPLGLSYSHAMHFMAWDAYELSDDPDLVWKNKNDYRFRYPNAFSYQTNARGLRGPLYPYEKPPGVVRILVLGDSQAFGFGVEDSEVYSRVLEARLDRSSQRRHQVINSGVLGYNQIQENRYLETEGIRYQPDIVVIHPIRNDVNLTGPRSPLSQVEQLKRFMTGDNDRTSRKLIHAGYSVAPYLTGLVAHLHRQRTLARSRSPHYADVLGVKIDDASKSANANALADSIRFCRAAGVRVLVFRVGVLDWARGIAEENGAPYRFLARPGDGSYHVSATDSHGNPRYHAEVAAGIHAALLELGYLR